ncbi:MAG: hypothetical protein ABI253_11890 [Mycobacterium sp.]
MPLADQPVAVDILDDAAAGPCGIDRQDAGDPARYGCRAAPRQLDRAGSGDLGDQLPALQQRRH